MWSLQDVFKLSLESIIVIIWKRRDCNSDSKLYRM